MPFSCQIQPWAGGLRVFFGLTSAVSLFVSLSFDDVIIGATNPTSIAPSPKTSSEFWGEFKQLKLL